MLLQIFPAVVHGNLMGRCMHGMDDVNGRCLHAVNSMHAQEQVTIL
jgi:hypothetical protein